jgi:tRNA(fMet)-specific endonuclease VapC
MIYILDTNTCIFWLKARLRKLGQPIADLDLLIASIALDEDAVLVTDNIKHFDKIPELKLENWK